MSKQQIENPFTNTLVDKKYGVIYNIQEKDKENINNFLLTMQEDKTRKQFVEAYIRQQAKRHIVISRQEALWNLHSVFTYYTDMKNGVGGFKAFETENDLTRMLDTLSESLDVQEKLTLHINGGITNGDKESEINRSTERKE